MATVSATDMFWKSVYNGADKSADELLESNSKVKPFSCILYFTIIPLFSFIVKMFKVLAGLKSIDDIVALEVSNIVLYARYYELKHGKRTLLRDLKKNFYEESETL